jgi:hypothetical protein
VLAEVDQTPRLACGFGRGLPSRPQRTHVAACSGC